MPFSNLTATASNSSRHKISLLNQKNEYYAFNNEKIIIF